MRVCLELSYNGGGFVGWQRQASGVSVQGVLEQALARLLGAPVTVCGAGRTDAGVHARQMFAHFDAPHPLPETAFTLGLNRLLPEAVAVRRVSFVADDFHAQYQACQKWYSYTLNCARLREPLLQPYCWHLGSVPDLAPMEAVAACWQGRHDFRAFCATGSAVTSTVRTVYEIRLWRRGPWLQIHVRGDGFLRHMVRIMVGTLVDVGRGRVSVDQGRQLVQGQERSAAGVTAPASGLCLQRIWYQHSVPENLAAWVASGVWPLKWD